MLKIYYVLVGKSIKAKDSPWDAVQMGSVVSTVITKIDNVTFS